LTIYSVDDVIINRIVIKMSYIQVDSNTSSLTMNVEYLNQKGN